MQKLLFMKWTIKFFSVTILRVKLGACVLASMNRTGKTNAKKGPKVDFNAYKDFHDREIEAHIIASFMEFAGMKSVQDKPTKCTVPQSWQSKEDKKAWLFNQIV
ncbi:unnamed protein product [Porites lobata]|uniref:Uncharacterized protein n=1 Tax=Porites lobata TaxID=104759 RepID=A0ABN8QFZ8_9CNID|nr:unnamed protein product [Porites lobata]